MVEVGQPSTQKPNMQPQPRNPQQTLPAVEPAEINSTIITNKPNATTEPRSGHRNGPGARRRVLTGWRGGAVPAEGQSGQGGGREAPQHVGEEVGVGGHGEPVEMGARDGVALPSHDSSSVHLRLHTPLKSNAPDADAQKP